LPTKRAKTRKSTSKNKKDVAAFVDSLHKDKNLRAKIRKGWESVIKSGKKKGYKFTRAELHNHLKKTFKLKRLPRGDEPDTCFCI
jgi:nitrogen fixation uncharacterized protein